MRRKTPRSPISKRPAWCWSRAIIEPRGRGGGEIDLIVRDPRDGTLVFVEVRQHAGATHGGAAGSITAVKKWRIVFAARHYLSRLRTPPPCRFDVVLVEERIAWIQAAFDAD